ncbi:cyclic nucleotide-binding domain-containing protein [Nitrosomonas communis]|uniref:cyclic nucleotide-binding domain-containing protein n=1 Tax=Nitrosomonas communis TaxID=44574 RepID=UPI003D2D6475
MNDSRSYGERQEPSSSAGNIGRRGKEVVLCDLPVREIFGELTAIDGFLRSATAIAKTGSLSVSILDKTFWELIHAYPAFCNAILSRLAGHGAHGIVQYCHYLTGAHSC